MKMPDRESVITHLQIIHTWAEFARERDLQFFTPKHLEDIAEWTDDAIALLKEQEEIISNYKETIENLLQQLQDIGKYMTPFGMVSDVRAYIEGRSQPEIIRCYACKHGEKCNSVYLCGKSRGFGIAHDPSWFCADGERKE